MRRRDPVAMVLAGANLVRDGAKKVPNRLTCAQTNWRTPIELLPEISAVLGGIGFDPCTEPGNPCGAERFVAPPADGRLVEWDDRTWCNPPFGSDVPTWITKVQYEAARGLRIGLLLSVTRSGTGYFQEMMSSRELTCFQLLRGRLRFSEGKSANIDSWIWWFGVDPMLVDKFMGWRGRIARPL